MNRLFLPLVLLGMLIAPLYSESMVSPVTGTEQSYTTSGFKILKPTIDCLRDQRFSIAGECAPQQGLKGLTLAGGAGAAGVAIVLALLGFISIVRRSSAFFTLLAGVGALAAMSWIGLGVYNAADRGAQLDWGSYAVGAAGLIAALAGILGMRSED